MRQKSAKLEDPTVQKCALHGWTGNSLLGDSQLPTVRKPTRDGVAPKNDWFSLPSPLRFGFSRQWPPMHSNQFWFVMHLVLIGISCQLLTQLERLRE